MPENESRREVLSGIAIFLLFVIGLGCSFASIMLFMGSMHQLEVQKFAMPASIFAVAASYSFGQLVASLRPK